MKAKNISYPYPVLGNDDDAKGIFDVSFKHALRRDEVVLKTSFKLENGTLEKLMKQGKAVFSAEVECPGTFLRKTFITHERSAEFSIPADAVRGHISVAFYIRAVEPVLRYEIDGCHPDYKGFKFDLSAGEVLAIGGFTSFDAEKDFDPLRPAISSLIAIKPGTHKDGPMAIGYNEDKILIKLSRNDYANYSAIKGRTLLAGVLHASIVLPVLADAIRLVMDKDEESQGMHWYRRIEIILRQQQLEDEDPLSAAQKILKSPVERCLSGLAEADDE